MTTKEKVLFFLEKNKGNHVSGTKMAEALNVSRNAVWKSIKQLEKEGYEIEAVTNKGYSLSETSNQISEIGIKENLTAAFKENTIFYYDTIDSTNKKAKELAIEGAAHGTLVVSNEQTAGKGRYGRSFESPKDTGIYMSVVLRPHQLSYSDPTMITSYAGVVVSQVVEELTGKKLEIKWVNDLFFEGKKVCGILTEAVTDFESGEMEWIVLGIGLNVSTSDKIFSADVKTKAGRIYQDKEEKVSRNQLISAIYESILTLHEAVNESELMMLYKEKSLVINKKVLLQQGKKEFYATVKDIDDAGQLVIEKETGELEIFNSGEIRIVL